MFLWSKDAVYDPDDPETGPAGLGGGSYVINESDHCWHEFSGLFESEDVPTDSRTLKQFVEQVEAVSAWNVFRPLPTDPTVMARLVE